MMDLAHLVRTTLPPSVRAGAGEGGLPRLSVKAAQASAEVYFQGAHVTAWRPVTADAPVLWMSGKSVFEPGKPIRGGVPICFPWFAAHPAAPPPAAPPHGFARLRDWALVRAQEEPAGGVTLELELTGRGLAPQWPHSFRISHCIHVGAVLRLELIVHNTGVEPFTFEEALHTYFAVKDIHAVSVNGLDDTEYLDKVAGGVRRHQPAEPLRFTGETDRVFLDTHAACVIGDPGQRREITISKVGSDSTVVWNPWINKSRAMPDFGDDEWRGMVCVETCNVATNARTLEPAGTHKMTAVIELHR
jgi:D-hexose-6-phosphate mutarotase